VPESSSNQPVRLTDNATYGDSQPDFSPDGRQIVYSSYRNGSQDIFVMKADGSGKKNLTRNAAWDADPAFSPDGRYIVFASNRDGDSDLADEGGRLQSDQAHPQHYRGPATRLAAAPIEDVRDRRSKQPRYLLYSLSV
jgi:dipeptidyl aminopeptidase/acylaminoacyl peptidase